MTFTTSIAKAFAIVCVATVIAEGIGLAYLWKNGRLTEDKRHLLLAAVHGVDVEGMRRRSDAAAAPLHDEQPAYKAVEDARLVASLNLDLRETAIEKALADLLYLQEQLNQEDKHYQDLKNEFDKEWTKINGPEAVAKLLEVQQTLQALSPKQAKDQLLKLLEGSEGGDPPSGENKQSIYDAITIIKSMPVDKQKKIFAQFTSPQDVDRLGDILKLIRLGIPEMTLLQETREQLEQFNRRLARG